MKKDKGLSICSKCRNLQMLKYVMFKIDGFISRKYLKSIFQVILLRVSVLYLFTFFFNFLFFLYMTNVSFVHWTKALDFLF